MNDDTRTRTREECREFYNSQEWARLRYKAIKSQGRRCQCCGMSREDHQALRLNVDHIKPVKFHWSLRLDPSNVQVLCVRCNRGKGSWDSTDWRPKTVSKPRSGREVLFWVVMFLVLISGISLMV